MNKILIIEDEEAIADLEKDYLELSGFQVEIEHEGDKGLERAMTSEYDLIILDLMLPGMDGFEICRRIRDEKNIPILMVSAKKDDIDKIRGLGLGADDYMTKPFSPSELVARVKAHLARYTRLVSSQQKTNDIVEIRGIRIDKTARRVYINGEEKAFTTKEFDLLTFLAENPNHVFTKEELFREIWPPIVAFAEEHHVKVAIENCPMWFDATNWPGGQNLFTTPDIWRRCFEILPSPNFGINYDPSHFIWQQMDYIRPLYEFKDRIFHVHYKDIKLYPEKLARVGVMAYPLQYMEPKLPGLGDVNWAKYVSALTDIGYSGYTCIEVEDRAFEGSRERILDSLRLSKRYLEQFVI